MNPRVGLQLGGHGLVPLLGLVSPGRQVGPQTAMGGLSCGGLGVEGGALLSGHSLTARGLLPARQHILSSLGGKYIYG